MVEYGRARLLALGCGISKVALTAYYNPLSTTYDGLGFALKNCLFFPYPSNLTIITLLSYIYRFNDLSR